MTGEAVHDPASNRYAPPSETERRSTSTYRVRFDEAGPDGIARASTYLRYAQDLAWLHSERRGFGRLWYQERSLAWVVRAVDLTIEAALPTGAVLTATTEVIGGRRVMARRRCDLRAEADGGPIATVLTDWVMTTTAGVPTRVPDAFPIAFGVPLERFEPTRVDPGEPPPEAEDGTPLLLMDSDQGRANTFFPTLVPMTAFIKPEPGLMVLFPSYLPHMVFAHQGKRPRISIAFNLRKEPFP